VGKSDGPLTFQRRFDHPILDVIGTSERIFVDRLALVNFRPVFLQGIDAWRPILAAQPS
jgi:hypothetical protein